MKVFITKYALTDGIFCIETEANNLGSIRYRRAGDTMVHYAHINELHLSLETACARAEDMRADKLKSLRKQIARLEALEFKVKEAV